MMTMKQMGQGGFTLIELMITVAIIGILAAIAYPSYTAQVQKSRRADAQVALLEMTQRQERYFLQGNVYSYAKGVGSNAGELGYGANSPENFYTLAIAATPNGCGGTAASRCTGYVATATATGPQVHDESCKTLSIDNRGAKSATKSDDTASSVCWK
ncbi:type IV pilin protein [Thiothrix nivea]|uniref:Pilus assembly protein n=1 Tax=Thiothrix nivea (strain ATCC 35100 / DSM 5205 / JP2) TaxID=870187 RepID=A0A656HE38_THINJ|nr:pilus assembly protein [Thiothrix nivea DSM 5205]